MTLDHRSKFICAKDIAALATIYIHSGHGGDDVDINICLDGDIDQGIHDVFSFALN